MNGGSDPAGARCWLLHRRHYRQSSAIWELLSEDGVRLAVVARAVRASKKRPTAVPGLGSRLRVWYRGRGDLHSLQRFELERAGARTGRALLYTLAANEFLVRATHRGDRHQKLPQLYRQLLENLERTPAAGERQRRADWLRFQLEALAAIGYGLDLTADASGAAIRPDGKYRLDEDCRLQPAPNAELAGTLLLDVDRRQLASPAALQTAQQLTSRLCELAIGGRLRGTALLSPRPPARPGGKP